MLVVPNSKLSFSTNDSLTPSDLSNHYEYINDLIKDVGGQRFAHTPITYQMNIDANTPLTDGYYTSNPETCRMRFTVNTFDTKFKAEVARINVSANYIASNGIDGYAFNNDGTVPTNVSNPIFNLPALATISNTPTEVVGLQSFSMPSAQDGYVEMRSRNGGTFSLQRCDVTMHIKTDGYNFNQVLNMDNIDYIFNESDARDANRINSINSSITNIVNSLSRTSYPALRPILFEWKNFNSSTSSSLLKIPIPVAETSKNFRVYSLHAWAVNPTSFTGNLAITLKDASNATLISATTLILSNQTFKSATTNLSSLASNAFTATNGPLIITNDCSISALSSAAPNIYRVYCLIWVGT